MKTIRELGWNKISTETIGVIFIHMVKLIMFGNVKQTSPGMKRSSGKIQSTNIV